MSTPTTRRPTSPKRSQGLGSVFGHGDLLASLLLVFPLFLIYGIGVIFAPAMNGVDFVSRNLFAIVGHSKQNYLFVHLGLAIVFVVLLLVLRRKRALGRISPIPMFLESGVYALTLGSLIVFVMRRVLGIEPSLAVGGNDAGTGIVLSCGAGLYEELVFRLGALSGGAALIKAAGGSRGVAVAAAFVISSALFSAAHHLGALGDPFTIQVFVYRMLAGMLFAAIYYYRSLAHAAYTHAFYDIYVMVIR